MPINNKAKLTLIGGELAGVVSLKDGCTTGLCRRVGKTFAWTERGGYSDLY